MNTNLSKVAGKSANLDICAHADCQKEAHLLCRDCKAVCYCSLTCLKKDLESHRPNCHTSSQQSRLTTAPSHILAQKSNVDWTDDFTYHFLLQVNVQSAHYKGKKKENLADRWIKVAEWVAKKTNQSYSSAAARKHWESLKDKFLAKHNLNADSNNVEDVINQLNELEIEENAAENLTRDLVHDVLNESYNKQKKNDEKTQKAVQQTMLEETSSKALDRAGNAALKAVENLPSSTSSSSFTLPSQSQPQPQPQQPKKKQRREVIDLEAIDECLVNLAKPSQLSFYAAVGIAPN
jgi:chemotaxis protein histidine kinase CheA